MKKWIKRIGMVVLVSVVLLGGTYLALNQPLPEGKTGPEAEALADKMLNNLGYENFQDSSYVLEWHFRGGFNYQYNLQKEQVLISWDKNQVDLNTKTQDGQVTKNGKVLDPGEERQELLSYAIKRFNNDSFWLLAPFKIKDPGTIRSVVETKQGKALLVTYQSGGSTPGDSYLWLLDEEGRPYAWKLWVRIIPVGGLKTTWEDWKAYEGFWLAGSKKGPLGLEVDVKPITVSPL
jgi:hypothetical protein